MGSAKCKPHAACNQTSVPALLAGGPYARQAVRKASAVNCKGLPKGIFLCGSAPDTARSAQKAFRLYIFCHLWYNPTKD